MTESYSSPVNLHLDGKRAIVTGASEGIGKAAALALAREGCDLAFCSRRAEALEGVAAEIRRTCSSRAFPVVADMSKLADIERFVTDAADELGGIDIVVNNAGASIFGSLFDVPDERWLADIELKLVGYVRVARAAISHMKEGGGRIINIGGNAGKQPLRYHLPGGAANAGISNFTVSLAQEVGQYGILVICLAPGPVRTARWERQIAQVASDRGLSVSEAELEFVADLPLRSIPTAEEVGDVVAFLASRRAAHITGTTVTMDGGITKGI